MRPPRRRCRCFSAAAATLASPSSSAEAEEGEPPVGKVAMMVLGRKSSTWAIRFDEHGRALRDMGRRAMAAGWSPSSPSPLELSMGHMQ